MKNKNLNMKQINLCNVWIRELAGKKKYYLRFYQVDAKRIHRCVIKRSCSTQDNIVKFSFLEGTETISLKLNIP